MEYWATRFLRSLCIPASFLYLRTTIYSFSKTLLSSHTVSDSVNGFKMVASSLHSRSWYSSRKDEMNLQVAVMTGHAWGALYTSRKSHWHSGYSGAPGQPQSGLQSLGTPTSLSTWPSQKMQSDFLLDFWEKQVPLFLRCTKRGPSSPGWDGVRLWGSGTAFGVWPLGAASLELLGSILQSLKRRAAVRWTEEGEGAPQVLRDTPGAPRPASCKEARAHSIA